jgi:hypothetical protein
VAFPASVKQLVRQRAFGRVTGPDGKPVYP